MISPIVLVVLVLVALGILITIRSRDLVRLLIGLELVFSGALLSILLVVSTHVIMAYALLIITVLVAVSETIFIIAIIYRLNRIKLRTTVEVGFEEK